MNKNGKVDSFRVERGQKYALSQNFLQVKIVEDSIWYKKVSGAGARVLQRLPSVKYKMYENGIVNSL